MSSTRSSPRSSGRQRAASPGRPARSNSPPEKKRKLAKANDAPPERDMKFWGQFHPDLLYCWLHTNGQQLDNEKLRAMRGNLTALVGQMVEANVARPSSSKRTGGTLGALQQAWHALHPLEALSDAPGRIPPPTTAGAPAPQPSLSNQEQHRGEGMEEEDTLAFSSPPPLRQLPTSPPQQTPPRNTSGNTNGQGRSAPEIIACRVCGVPPAGRPATSAWNCGSCGFRGDLDASELPNVILRENRLQRTAEGHSNPTASRTNGQSTTVAPVSNVSSLTPAERELKRQLELFSDIPFPLFASATAGDTVTHTEAIGTLRKVKLASHYVRPNEHLIRLIRAGRLTQVGYALPRSVSDILAQRGTEVQLGDGTSIVNTHRGAAAPPSLNSFSDFCNALFSTILPAISDKPAALIQWIALAQAVRTHDELHGWQSAQSLLSAVLTEAVTSNPPTPFIPYDHRIDLDHSNQRTGQSQATGSKGLSTPAQKNDPKVCVNWNYGRGCARVNSAGACELRHECLSCKGDHPRNACPAIAQHKPSSGNKPFNNSKVRFASAPSAKEGETSRKAVTQ